MRDPCGILAESLRDPCGILAGFLRGSCGPTLSNSFQNQLFPNLSKTMFLLIFTMVPHDFPTLSKILSRANSFQLFPGNAGDTHKNPARIPQGSRKDPAPLAGIFVLVRILCKIFVRFSVFLAEPTLSNSFPLAGFWPP